MDGDFMRMAAVDLVDGRRVHLYKHIDTRRRLAAFTLFTLLGSLMWNTILIVAGYMLAEQWDKVLDYTEPFQYVVITLIGVLVVALVVRKVVLIGRERAAEELAHPGLAHETFEEVVEELEAQADGSAPLSTLHNPDPAPPV